LAGADASWLAVGPGTSRRVGEPLQATSSARHGRRWWRQPRGHAAWETSPDL